MFIHWDATLETGQPLMDAEHRILVLLFRRLDVAIKTNQSDLTLKQITHEVQRFVAFHFVSEENLMRETNYPDLEAHAALHGELRLALNAFVAKITFGSEFHEDLLYFMNHWLIGHIAMHDQRVAEHVRGAVARPVAEFAYRDYLSMPSTAADDRTT